MKKSTAGCLIFLTMVPADIWSGFVGSTMWRWFAEPIGAVHVSVVRAMGLACLASLYRYSGEIGKALEKSAKTSDGDADDAAAEFSVYLMKVFGFPAFVLFWGWLYSMFL